ncbi:MAG TPA: prenyltransferase [Desulfomonilia bacterium]
MTTRTASFNISDWTTAMRIPFATVAVVPFCVGILLAIFNGVPVSLPASISGVIAVFLICTGCHLIGETADKAEDAITLKTGRTKFSGGTLSVVQGKLNEKKVMKAAFVCFTVSAILGGIIFYIHRSFWLVGLGSFGAAAAIFYSMPPVRLAKRGMGELVIGVCYGWLTIVTGYACASNTMPPDSYIWCWPVALTVFNIILINEFPDYIPDSTTGKRNIVVRIGMEKSQWIYTSASILTGISIFSIWLRYRPFEFAFLAVALPGILLSFALAYLVAVKKLWKSHSTIEPVCALTIVLNHISSITIALLVRW